jgi:hypothetical protein
MENLAAAEAADQQHQAMLDAHEVSFLFWLWILVGEVNFSPSWCLTHYYILFSFDYVDLETN